MRLRLTAWPAYQVLPRKALMASLAVTTAGMGDRVGMGTTTAGMEDRASLAATRRVASLAATRRVGLLASLVSRAVGNQRLESNSEYWDDLIRLQLDTPFAFSNF